MSGRHRSVLGTVRDQAEVGVSLPEPLLPGQPGPACRNRTGRHALCARLTAFAGTLRTALAVSRPPALGFRWAQRGRLAATLKLFFYKGI